MEGKQQCITGQSVTDAELGSIVVRVNARARRLIFRAVEGGFVVTVPLGATWSDVTKGLETLRPRLRETQARRSEKLIDLNQEMASVTSEDSYIKGFRDGAAIIMDALNQK